MPQKIVAFDGIVKSYALLHFSIGPERFSFNDRRYRLPSGVSFAIMRSLCPLPVALEGDWRTPLNVWHEEMFSPQIFTSKLGLVAFVLVVIQEPT